MNINTVDIAEKLKPNLFQCVMKVAFMEMKLKQSVSNKQIA